MTNDATGGAGCHSVYEDELQANIAALEAMGYVKPDGARRALGLPRADVAVARAGGRVTMPAPATTRLAIPELNDVEVTFGAPPPLPAWTDIPEEFKRDSNPFSHIASMLFFKGGKLADYGLTPKEGVDAAKAMRALRCCLGSFSPKHEHKTAGVGFMLSEWFDLAQQKKRAHP